MTTDKKIPLFRLTEHICRSCGGRILLQTNSGPTGGGNPVYQCADCGARISAMGPEPLCWCGAEMRGGASMNLMCVLIADARHDPLMMEALSHCGCGGPGYQYEVGVISQHVYRFLRQQDWDKRQEKK